MGCPSAASLLLLVLLASMTAAYKHIIFMHGFMASPTEFSDLHRFINKTHPGTTFSVIDAFNNLKSLQPMWHQVGIVGLKVKTIMKQHPEGVHLLCYSQGGVLCRGLVESIDNHNVLNFISLSSPQGGQFGDTVFLKKIFPLYVRNNMYKLFYTKFGQRFSVANYWNDPHHQPLYRNYSVYLAKLNHDTPNPVSMNYTRNFLKLKNLVLIGGPNDEVVTPWQSSQFGFYDANLKIIPMKQQKRWYQEDSFGLRTLDKRGSVHTCTMSGITHFNWHKNFTVYTQCIEKWLT